MTEIHVNYKRALILCIPFLVVWFWSASYNPLTHIPSYGDALEVVWGANWYAQNLTQLSNPFYYEGVFYPTGWPTALLAHTPIFLLAMGLFRLILTEAATYNLFLFASFVTAYAGMIKAASLYSRRLWITALVALLYTFWNMRWVRVGGHLNILWLTALLPWLFWILQMAKRRNRIVGAALVWTFCIIASLYGVWLGALIVGIYFLNKPSLDRLKDMAAIALLTLILSLPTLIPFWHARQQVASPFFSLDHIAGWGASLNSLILPSVFHPWLGTFVQTIYRGPLDESGVANLGMVAFLVFVAALLQRSVYQEKERFALLLCVLGLIIALGPALRWNGRSVEAPQVEPVNRVLWDLGHLVKPETFPESIPDSLASSVPLPSWILYAAVPFLEGNRVVARFTFVGYLGLLLLLAMLLERVKAPWLLAALTFLLLFEQVPWPVAEVPIPINSHPAFDWLSMQQGAVIDLVPAGQQLTLAASGETLYATSLHQKPTASAVSSMWPESAWFLYYWLQQHSQPLQHEDFPAILQGYGVNHVLVHMQTADSDRHFAAEQFAGFDLVNCFDAPQQASPWPYPICVLQAVEHDNIFDVTPEEGWSAPESWGRWAEGTESIARWVVPDPLEYELIIDAFPNWVENKTQEVTIQVNGRKIGSLTFTENEPLGKSFLIPANLLNLGWNQITFTSEYAIAPVELTDGANPDPRPLSFGVSRLYLRPSADSP